MQRTGTRCRGALLVGMAAALSIATAAALAISVAGSAVHHARERASDRALALAREALLAYAQARPIDAIVGPGYLPCPDLDNDGWAESTCGSMSGDSGQAQRLGRLPWKTLGIPDIRDGHGERLWYAVSSKYKGLLNCTVSAACIDMSPDSALGTITVRDASGLVLHDGRLADLHRANAGGAVAVVIAPGPALERIEGTTRRFQDRTCAAGACERPANYLDRAPAEDNADFVDRNDPMGRAANGNGFIRGPVRLADGSRIVNDRLLEITYDDIVPRVMRRVAQEVASCLRTLAASGPLPVAAPLCRVPESALSDCTIAASTPAPTWWLAWREHVFYALAPPEGGAAARAAVIVRRNPDPAAHECGATLTDVVATIR